MQEEEIGCLTNKMAQNGLLKRLGIYAVILASFGAGLFASKLDPRRFRTPPYISADSALEDRVKKTNPAEVVEEDLAPAEPDNHNSEPLEIIVSMKNSKGKNLFNCRADAVSYLDAGGSVDEIESLSRILTEDGKRIFDQGQWVTALKRQNKLVDGVRLALKKDNDVNLFRSGSQIVKFLLEGGEADYEEKFFSLKNRKGKQAFSEYNLLDYVKAGGTYNEAVELLNAENNGEMIAEDGYDLAFLKENNLSLADLRRFFALQDNRDEPIFSCLYDIRRFVRNGSSYSRLMEYLSLKDSEGRIVFDSDFELADIAKDDSEFRRVKRLLRLRNQGKLVFTHGEDARKYLGLGGTIDFAEEAAQLIKPNRDIYRGFDLFLFKYLKVSDEEVMAAMKEGRDVLFQDTHKPNALVIYPLADHNAVFRNDPSLEFLKKIHSAYDMRLVISPNEQTAYSAIESTPDTRLLILCGHGAKDCLVLGRGDDETSTLDLSDTELNRYLSMLYTRAVIFLDSCLNAEGGKGAKNLANFTAGLARRRNVIYAARTSFCAPGIHVKKLYPFKVQIISGGDQTYRAK